MRAQTHLTLVATSLLYVAVAAPSAAQTPSASTFARPIGFVRPQSQHHSTSVAGRTIASAEDDDSGLYFIAGATIGGFVGLLAAGVDLWTCSHCKTVPVVAIGLVSGTVVGGLLGSLVYALKK
jgi:hypothetical protein